LCMKFMDSRLHGNDCLEMLQASTLGALMRGIPNLWLSPCSACRRISR